MSMHLPSEPWPTWVFIHQHTLKADMFCVIKHVSFVVFLDITQQCQDNSGNL
jgi:hypothetical protein